MSSLTSTSTSIDAVAVRDPRARRRREPEPRGVDRMDQRGAAELALRERRQVVHPAVVRAQLAAADRSRARAPARARSARARAEIRRRSSGGASSILPDGVRSISGIRGASAPRSMPAARSACERQPARASEASPYGPARSARSSRRSGPRRLRDRARAPRRPTGPATRRTSSAASSSSSASTSTSAPRPRRDRDQPQQDLPLGGMAGRRATAPAGCSARCCATRAAGTRRRSARPRAASSPGRITSAWRVVSLR